ncbi:MAG: CocE/NonD family hydrolase [Bacillota bacterium]
MESGEHYRRMTQVAPMCDGVTLATDIYLPEEEDDEASWPVILIRTPYDRSGEQMVEIARYFTACGYACVIQDVRGRYGSEGEFEPFVNEAEDGHDCISWVGRQDWCDGRVGTMGTSYLAQTQASMATTDPPYLTSQYISQGYGSYHRTRSRRGGAFENHRFNWILKMAATSREARRNPTLKAAVQDMQKHLMEWLREGYPLRRGQTPLALLRTYEQALIDYMTRGELDEFWHNPGLNLDPHFDEYKDVPVTWLGSWYDGYTLETPRNYREMARSKKSPQRLIMGPWIHSMSSEKLTFAGDVDFGPDAAFASLEERRRWFDRTLKGIDNGVDREAPVKIFVMGGGTGSKLPSGRLDHGGTWRDEQQWPLARALNRRYFLHRGGSLSTKRPTASKPTTYDFDPANPVPSTAPPGQNVFSSGGGGYHQRQDPSTGAGQTRLPHAARRDVLVFQTEPLSEDVEITGPIEVVLYVSSSAVDTDFTAKLIDQYPPHPDCPEGYALELTHSLQRCRYRGGYEREELMTPGKTYELRFPLPPTSNLFAAGHRIRVDVSSSNWPKYEVNPNTGEPPGRHRTTEVARNSVFHDAKHPSHITLPVVPEGRSQSGRGS